MARKAGGVFLLVITTFVAICFVVFWIRPLAAWRPSARLSFVSCSCLTGRRSPLVTLTTPVPRVSIGCALTLPVVVAAPQLAATRAQKRGEAELLDLHRQERRAHFEHDVNFFLAHLGSQLLDVREAQVNRMSREDVRAKFLEYSKNAKFSAWDDVEAPVVHISADGNTAWMIVRVRIAYTETDQAEKTTNQSTVGAWMSACEKHNGTWFMTAVASTFAEK